MLYSTSYVTYILLHPLYVPYPICTSHSWAFPPSASPIRPPRGFSPRKFPLYAHFVSKPYSPHIISGFFQLSSPPHAHRVGFLPEKLLSTPISPANHTLRTSSLGFSAPLLRPTPTTWVFSPEISSLRPFCQQTILSAHHLWVFPSSASPIRPPRGFSPRGASLYAHFASID